MKFIYCKNIFAKPDKVRQQFVILSEVEKKSPKAISVDLGLAKTWNCPVLQLRCNPPLLFPSPHSGAAVEKTGNIPRKKFWG